MGIISESGSFRGQFGDHFRVGDHFGVGIISGAVQLSGSSIFTPIQITITTKTNRKNNNINNRQCKKTERYFLQWRSI